MRKLRFFGFLVALLLPSFQILAADGVGVFVFFPERQQERRQSRWTLGEWLSTKKTIADQNLWLSKHTNKVPMDLSYTLELRAPGRLAHEIDFFLAWLGLRARYEYPAEFAEGYFTAPTTHPRHREGEAGFGVRLAGGNPQNTSLVLRGLFEYRDVDALGAALNGAYKGWFLEPELQIYLAPWLGLRGIYQKRFGLDATSIEGQQITGNSWSALAFLEANSARIEFGYENTEWNFVSGSGALLSTFTEASLLGRLRFFF